MSINFIFIFSLISTTISIHYPIYENIFNSKRGKVKAIDIETYETYLDYIKNHDYVVGYFHSYKILNKKWVFIKIDCARNSNACLNNGVDQFPNAEIYRNHEIVDAELPTDLVPLLELLYKLSSEPLIEIKSKEDFYANYTYYSPIVEVDKLPIKKEKLKKNKNDDDEDDDEESDKPEETDNNEEIDDFYQCIKKIANEDFIKNFYFGIMETKDFKEKIVFDNENFPVTYLWDGICDNAINFLRENKYPLLSQVDQYFLKELEDESRLLVSLMTFPQNEKINYLLNSLYKKLAYENREYIFGYIDYVEDPDIFNNSFKIELNNTNEIQLIINDFIDRSHYIHKPVFSLENQTDVEIIDEIKKILLNITNLKFETGSKFQDFINRLGINKMNNTQQVILIIVMIIFLLILVYFCGSPEDLEDDEFYEYEEVDTTGKEKSS